MAREITSTAPRTNVPRAIWSLPSLLSLARTTALKHQFAKYAAQVKAALSVNRELVALYWDIGAAIVQKQFLEGWGAKVIERLANDIQISFPGIAGFSRANVYRMRAFYLSYQAPGEIVARPARQLAARGSLPQPVPRLPAKWRTRQYTPI